MLVSTYLSYTCRCERDYGHGLKGERSKLGTCHNTKYLSMQGRSSMTCWTWTKTALVTPKQRRELR